MWCLAPSDSPPTTVLPLQLPPKHVGSFNGSFTLEIGGKILKVLFHVESVGEIPGRKKKLRSKFQTFSPRKKMKHPKNRL